MRANAAFEVRTPVRRELAQTGDAIDESGPSPVPPMRAGLPNSRDHYERSEPTDIVGQEAVRTLIALMSSRR